MKNLKRLLLSSFFFILAVSAWAGEMDGGNYTVTKDLFGASGASSVAGPDYSMAFAWGEPISGNLLTQPTYSIISGYFGGGFGNGSAFTVVSTLIGATGTPVYMQDHVQVGLPYQAPVQIVLSDQVLPETIASGVQAVIAVDHLGVPIGSSIPITTSFNPANDTLTVLPQSAWSGGTLYDIQVTPALLSVDGFPLDAIHHIFFMTMLDPKQDNVVITPLPTGTSAPNAVISAGAMTANIPTPALSDFAIVLVSHDPVHSPIRVAPSIILDANQKAVQVGGPYREPLTVQEVVAYDTHGNVMGPLSTAAQITVGYSGGTQPSLVRTSTLAIWALDEVHHLWVKMPASQNSGFQTITATVSNFSVFALMGGPDGSATDSFAFPIPWRPHGPNAGSGPGQTGTEMDGITFSNLPSECTIKIYTLAGGLVQQIHHSDTGGLLGQQTWDVKTDHGEPAASGVYLWRVESSSDGKNGKLMVIR